MLDVVDRNVATPRRRQLVPVSGQPDQYDVYEVPGTVTEEGTDVNRALFMALQGMEASLTEFNPDGSITETYDTGVLTTTFPDADTIVETFVGDKGTVVKTTTFNLDGSISEVIS